MAEHKNVVELDPVMELALERFKYASDAEKDNREAMKGDLEFYVSDQWDGAIRSARVSSARPCLTINRLPQFTRQITNNLRQNMPSIKIIPVEDSDEEVAEIFNGMIRHIQEASEASAAYACANNSQVICGLGYFRIITEYVSDDSFEQEIKIKRIKNSLSVYVDPAAMEPDYSDARYMFITYDLPKEEFKRIYTDKQTVDNDLLTGKGDKVRSWLTADDDVMRIAEYFSIEEGEKVTLYQLEDGSVVNEVPEGMKEVNKRTVTKDKVVWRIISAVEVLDEMPWAGKYIPIVPVIGEDMDVDGKRIIKGMVRDAQDPQRMYNYMVSAETEAIALAPKAPFIAAIGQIEGFKQFWETANTNNWSYLPYKPLDINGTPVPPPQRQNVEPPIQAMTLAMNQFADDLKAVTGIYDASLGAKGNEVSGKAINARKLQGDVANYHYGDNLAYSQRHAGKILLDMIPKIYDTERIVRCLGLDGQSEYKKINQPSGERDANGIEKIYDLSVGKFDVVVETGASYQTKRQEATETMTQLAQGNPELMQVAGDIIVRNMDLPGSQELSDRLKKALPPQLQDDDKNAEIPIKVKQQLDQSSQMIEQLTQTVHQLQDEADQKTKELESRERIELEKINAQITLKSMELEGAASHALLVSELKGINDRLSLLNINQPVDNSQVDNGKNSSTINQDAGANPLGA